MPGGQQLLKALFGGAGKAAAREVAPLAEKGLLEASLPMSESILPSAGRKGMVSEMVGRGGPLQHEAPVTVAPTPYMTQAPDPAAAAQALGLPPPEAMRFRPESGPAKSYGASWEQPIPESLQFRPPEESYGVQQQFQDPGVQEIIEGFKDVLVRGKTDPVELLKGPVPRREIGRLAALSSNAPVMGSHKLGTGRIITGFSPATEEVGPRVHISEGTVPGSAGWFAQSSHESVQLGQHGGLVGRAADELGEYVPKELQRIIVSGKAGGTPEATLAHEVGHAVFGIRDKASLYGGFLNILKMSDKEARSLLENELMPLSIGGLRRKWGEAFLKDPSLYQKGVEYITRPEELLADGVMGLVKYPDITARVAPRFTEAMIRLANADPQLGARIKLRTLIPLAAAGMAAQQATSGPGGLVNELGQ